MQSITSPELERVIVDGDVQLAEVHVDEDVTAADGDRRAARLARSGRLADDLELRTVRHEDAIFKPVGDVPARDSSSARAAEDLGQRDIERVGESCEHRKRWHACAVFDRREVPRGQIDRPGHPGECHAELRPPLP
jgi:hypothetical protein